MFPPILDHYLSLYKGITFPQSINDSPKQSHDEPLRKCASALSVRLSFRTRASATLFDENPISRRSV